MKRIFLLVCCLVLAGFTAAEAAVIYMKSGREIHTETFYKENGMVYYSVAGQTVGVPESMVERIDESVNDSMAGERLITIRMPRYYEVTSTLAGVETGLYEEVFYGKPCPTYRKLFGEGVLYATGCGASGGTWILGKVIPNSPDTEPLAILRHVAKGQGPDYRGALWTAAGGRVCEVQVKPGKAPASTTEEKLVLKFNGFPNAFFNGIYKPYAVVNGRIAYKMKKAKDEATIELRSGVAEKPYYYWAVSFGNDTYYLSAHFDTPNGLYPHEIKSWTREGSVRELTEVVGEVYTARKHTFEFQE